MEVKEHRVSPHLSKVIKTIIEEKTASGEIAAYKQYLQDNSLVKYKNRIKFPTYEGLQYLLDSLGISYKEFLERANAVSGSSVAWATSTQQRMADNLDAMSPGQRSAVLETVTALLSDQVAEALKNNENNPAFGLRITNVLEASSNEDNNMFRLYTKLGISAKWRQNKRENVIYASVPHEYMPALSNETGVSLHWLLGWDAAVLAANPETERVMDYFCFLAPELQQLTLEQAITNNAKTGGIILG